MRAAESVSESQDCEAYSVQYHKPDCQTEAFFATRSQHQKGKTEKPTRETVTLYRAPTTCKKQWWQYKNVTSANIAHVESRPQLHVSLVPEASPSFQLPSPSYALVPLWH